MKTLFVMALVILAKNLRAAKLSSFSLLNSSWKLCSKLPFNSTNILKHINHNPRLSCILSAGLYTTPVLDVSPFTLGARCHQRSLRVGAGSGRSATDTPWDTAAAWRERRYPPWCRRWSWGWIRLSGGCCSRSPPGRPRGTDPPQKLCGTRRALIKQHNSIVRGQEKEQQYPYAPSLIFSNYTPNYFIPPPPHHGRC